MYTDYYGLSFNPFDKQMVKEKDAFESEDFREMTARLEYLKEIRGIGVFTASPEWERHSRCGAFRRS